MNEIEIEEVTLKCQDESPMCEGMLEFRTSLKDGTSIYFCDYHWHIFQSFDSAMGR